MKTVPDDIFNDEFLLSFEHVFRTKYKMYKMKLKPPDQVLTPYLVFDYLCFFLDQSS